MTLSSRSVATPANAAGPNGLCNGCRNSLHPRGVELNTEKTAIVNTLEGDAFVFPGLDLRRVAKRHRPDCFILLTPRKKARKAITAKIRDLIRHAGATPIKALIARLNAAVAGWVNYFRVGNSKPGLQ